MAKGLKLKVRKFWRLIPMLVEVTEEKLLEGGFLAPLILNRFMIFFHLGKFHELTINLSEDISKRVI